METPTVTCAKSNDVVLAASIGNCLKNVLLVENSQSKFLIFASAPKCRGAVLEATMIGDGGTFHAHAQ